MTKANSNLACGFEEEVMKIVADRVYIDELEATPNTV